MRADVLTKYLKKIRLFADEKGVSYIYSSVAIQGNEHELKLTCSDGNCGIVQTIPQPAEKSEKIMLDCLVDVFSLSKIIERIEPTADVILKRTPGGTLNLVSGKSVKIKINEYDFGNRLNVFNCDHWTKLDHDFLVEMKSVSPVTDEFEAPIVYKDGILFLQNAKALFYKKTDKFNKDFTLDPKYLRKLLVDDFKEINVNVEQVHLRNESCRIYVPTFNGRIFDIKPLLNRLQNYTIKCKVASEDLKNISSILKELSDQNKSYDQRIQIKISKEEFKIIFYDSEFNITNYVYNHDFNFDFMIPLIHLRASIKETFATRDAQYIFFKLTSEEYNTFICENVAGVSFIGGLWRERRNVKED